MRCKKCGVEIEETSISGYCGYCAYRAYKSKSSNSPFETTDLTSLTEGPTNFIVHDKPQEVKTVGGVEVIEEDTEQIFLNALINDHFTITKAVEEGFVPEMFATKLGQELGEVILELFKTKSDRGPIDTVAIRNLLKLKGFLTPEMDTYLKGVLAQQTPKFDKAKLYMDIMKQRMNLESLRTIQKRIASYLEGEGSDRDMNLVDFTAEIAKQVRDLQKKTADKKVKLIKEQMIEISKQINQREIEGEIEQLGYSIKPYYDLNTSLSGLRRGFLYGIAGAPRRGKTTLMLEVATMVAANEKVPVLFYTWEQTRQNLTYRLLAKESQINPDTLQRKRVLNDDELEEKFQIGWRKMERYMNYFHLIEGTKQDTVDRIKSHAYNVMQQFDTDKIVIFVDYIQKMPLAKDYKDEKFKVEEISTQLKGLTIELNCPVVAISSLNKEGCNIDGTDSDERPTLYHCKGSGDIEYDLDVAMILAKDWGDSKEMENQLKMKAEAMGKDTVHIPKVDVVNVYIDKNRDAPEGISSVIQFFFIIEANKYVELGYKLETDVYRFAKVENMIQKLLDEGYIRFRDIKDDYVGKDGEPIRRRKIRLKYN